MSAPGQYGVARSNDIIPNGPIVPINVSLPGTLTLSTYQTYGNSAVLMVICSGTFSYSTLALPTTGPAIPADTLHYIPVNGQDTLYINGSGTFRSNLFTSRSQSQS